MNEEKKIAGAIMDAQKMREESYDHSTRGSGYGTYKLEMEECLIRTCKQRGLSPNLWVLLNLAMHWYNDIQLWAEDIFAGRDVGKDREKLADRVRCFSELEDEKAVDENE